MMGHCVVVGRVDDCQPVCQWPAECSCVAARRILCNAHSQHTSVTDLICHCTQVIAHSFAFHDVPVSYAEELNRMSKFCL